MIFAIIPARGGSQRIKKKNIKKFYSRTILYWTLKILRMSKLFSKIILTTDSNEIKAIGKKLGFDYIISRPKNLADNYTPIKPVIEHAIKTLSKDFKFQYVCCVFPCNPFLSLADLKKSFKILMKNKKNFVFPVSEYSHPIQRAFHLNKKNKIVLFNKKNELKRTQDLKKYYHDTGQFYWGLVKNWLNNKINIHSRATGFKIPKWRSIDIDTQDDWQKAEALFGYLKEKKNNII